MSFVFCNQCGHRNPPESAFCSACGAALEPLEEHTISIARVDPHQDAIGHEDNPTLSLGEIPANVSATRTQRIVRSREAHRARHRLRRLRPGILGRAIFGLPQPCLTQDTAPGYWMAGKAPGVT